MKIKFNNCSHCHPPTTITEFQFNEEGIYSGKCPNGHDINFMTSLPLYEILFSIGIQSFKDGYYCETVRSMTASLERFHEHFLKSFILGHTGDHLLTDDSWKEVRNQSERQYGAFVIFFTAMFKKNPPSLSDKDRNFRNNIIHKGQIAKKEETLDYCSKILEIESYCLDKIFKRFEEVEKQYGRYLNKERESKGNPKIAYINWEPVGHIFNKTTMEKDLTIEKILTRDYVI